MQLHSGDDSSNSASGSHMGNSSRGEDSQGRVRFRPAFQNLMETFSEMAQSLTDAEFPLVVTAIRYPNHNANPNPSPSPNPNPNPNAALSS